MGMEGKSNFAGFQEDFSHIHGKRRLINRSTRLAFQITVQANKN